MAALPSAPVVERRLDVHRSGKETFDDDWFRRAYAAHLTASLDEISTPGGRFSSPRRLGRRHFGTSATISRPQTLAAFTSETTKAPH
jgi:hypothetical protein